MMRRRIWWIVLVALLVVPATASAAIIDRIVARVNDDVVTLYDVRQAAIPYVLQQGINPAILKDPGQRGPLYKKVLEDLVDRMLLLQEAKKLDLSISDQELDQWLAFTRQRQHMTKEQFAAMIAQYGMRYDAYREMVRDNLLKIRMIKIKVGSQVNVTQDEVDAAYKKQYGAEGGKEKYVTVSHILFRPKDGSPQAAEAAKARAEAALKRVRNGEDFATVAKEMSDGPTADKGGFLGTFHHGELDPTFEKAAFALGPGQVSDVVHTKFGYHIIKVSKVELKQPEDIQARKDDIRGQLQQQTMQKLLKQYVQTLRSRAFVDIRY